VNGWENSQEFSRKEIINVQWFRYDLFLT
jgi:hypothetical protein